MGAEQMTGLVIEAEDPLDNRIKIGRSGKGQVRILVDREAEPDLRRAGLQAGQGSLARGGHGAAGDDRSRRPREVRDPLGRGPEHGGARRRQRSDPRGSGRRQEEGAAGAARIGGGGAGRPLYAVSRCPRDRRGGPGRGGQAGRRPAGPLAGVARSGGAGNRAARQDARGGPVRGERGNPEDRGRARPTGAADSSTGLATASTTPCSRSTSPAASPTPSTSRSSSTRAARASRSAADSRPSSPRATPPMSRFSGMSSLR